MTDSKHPDDAIEPWNGTCSKHGKQQEFSMVVAVGYTPKDKWACCPVCYVEWQRDAFADWRTRLWDQKLEIRTWERDK